MLASIVYVLTSGCSWRDLRVSFGVPFQTAHRRFGQWARARLWRKLHRPMLDELGSNIHVLSERGGLPLSVAVSASRGR